METLADNKTDGAAAGEGARALKTGGATAGKGARASKPTEQQPAKGQALKTDGATTGEGASPQNRRSNEAQELRARSPRIGMVAAVGFVNGESF